MMITLISHYTSVRNALRKVVKVVSNVSREFALYKNYLYLFTFYKGRQFITVYSIGRVRAQRNGGDHITLGGNDWL